MTTPTYQVNGSITFHGVRSDWQRIPKRTRADGVTEWQDYAINTWDIGQAEMSAFESLRSLQGAALSSLATNDPADRNEAATYTTVEVGLVNAAQTGRRAVGLHIEFKVKVS